MYTTNTSASGPFVIHIFEPFATQPPSTRSRATAHRAEHVRAGVGLAHRERADVLSRQQGRAATARAAGRCRSPRGCARTGSSAPRTTCPPTPRRATAPRRSRGARGSRAPRRRRPRPPSDRARRGPRGSGQSRRGNASSRRSRRRAGATSRSANVRTVSRSSSSEIPLPWSPSALPSLRRLAPSAGSEGWRSMARGRCDRRSASGSSREERCPVCPRTSTPARRPSARTRRRCTQLVDDLRGAARERVGRGGGEQATRAPPRRAGKLHRARTRSSGSSTPARRSSSSRRSPPCDLYDGEAPGAGHRHRHRPRARVTLRDRRERRHREGRHLLPDHGEEAPARAGDRAREPPAVHLPRRLGRRVPAAAGRGLPRPRPLRAHLLQPGAHVRRRDPADRGRDGLVHRRRRLRARDVGRDRDRARHRHDLPRRAAAREGGDRRGRRPRGARGRRRARATERRRRPRGGRRRARPAHRARDRREPEPARPTALGDRRSRGPGGRRRDVSTARSRTISRRRTTCAR